MPPDCWQILGNMKKDARSLMLVTVMKNLQKLGYALKVNGSSYAACDCFDISE